MKKIRTRFLSAFLALLTLLTLLPTSALAASGSGTGIKPTTMAGRGGKLFYETEIAGNFVSVTVENEGRAEKFVLVVELSIYRKNGYVFF